MMLVVITQEIEIEPYLINELNYTKNQFSKIVIITTSKNNYRFPDATTIISKRTDFFFSCLLYSIRKIFSKEALQEFKDSYKMRVRPSTSKMIYTWIISWMIEKRVDHYLKATWNKEPIILYSYWLNQYAYCVAKTKKRFPQLTAVARAHGFEVRDGNDYIPFRRIIDSYLDKIVFISEYTMNEYNTIISGITNKKRSLQKVIKLGTVNHFEYQQRQFIKDQSLTIISCSGVYDLKRLDLIIDSISLLPESFFINWIHFGSGSEMINMKELAKKKLASPNITFEFKGECSNYEVLRYYETQPVFLFINMSNYEGIPVSIMEAMSFGVPCMARNVGGNAEIVIDNVSGVILPNQVSPEIVAEYLQRFILMMQNNPEYYENLCNSTYHHWSQNFNSEKNFSDFVEYIAN